MECCVYEWQSESADYVACSCNTITYSLGTPQTERVERIRTPSDEAKTIRTL